MACCRRGETFSDINSSLFSMILISYFRKTTSVSEWVDHMLSPCNTHNDIKNAVSKEKHRGKPELEIEITVM